MENVPGVFSTNGGEDFRAFLRKIDEIGYSCAWRVLDAQYVRVDGYPRAVPQRRRRVFVVGYLGDWRYPASVLFEPGCLPGNTPPRRVKGEGIAADAKGGNNEAGSGVFWNGNGRPLNVICRAGDMANSETSVEVGTTLLARQYKSPPFVCDHETGQGYWQDGDIAGTLRAEGENRPSRPSNIICAGFSGGQGDNAGGECCPQINAKAGTGGGNLPLVQEVFPINSMIIGKNVKVGDRQTTGIGNNGDPLPTISSAHHHAVAIAENTIVRKENNGGNGTGAQEELAYTQNATGVMGVSVKNTVRRLLPIETERLMGFPDNWTRIPWRGKPEEQCPDGPRYKAC